MSLTARVALIVVCWTVSVTTELAAIGLLVRESRRARRVLGRWRNAPPGVSRPPELFLDQLLANRFDRSAAVVLLVTGVATGALGNFLSL
jgi:hypothetical protein